MADNSIEIELTAKIDKLDTSINKVLDKLEKDVEKASTASKDHIENNFIEGFKSAALAAAPFVIALEAVKKAVELAFEGEKIAALNAQFELLSSSAGLAADTLKNKLVGASQGLIGDTELIESANKALITLGSSASRIPETLAIATKAAQVFGIDAVQAFELFNNAVASGNLRGLRQIGIVVDQERALKDYANTLGVSVSSLTEAGKKQALLNAAIEQGNKAFKDIDPKAQALKSSYEQLKIAAGDAYDALAIISKNTIGPALTAFFQTTTSGIQSITVALKELSGQAVDPAEKIKSINSQLEVFNRRLAEQQALNANSNGSIIGKFFGDLQVKQITEQINKAEAELARLKGIQAQAEDLKAQSTENSTSPTASPILFNQEQFNAEQAKRVAAIQAANAQVTAIQLQGQSDAEFALTDSLGKQAQLEADFEAQRAQLLFERKDASKATQALIDEQIVANTILRNQKLAELEQQANLTGLKSAELFKQGVVGTLAGGIQNIVSSLAKGKNAFEEFGKFLLGTLGDLAIQMGTMIIAAGVAKSALVTDLFGGATIAAGVALVAVGALLKAFSGGSGSPESASGGGGGGGVGFTGPASQDVTGFAPQNQDATRGAGTKVVVNVEGNVFNQRDTGLEIARIIQDQFNNNGQVIATGVV